MGGEASKEETELANDKVEAAVDVTVAGSAESVPGPSQGNPFEGNDPGGTHEIEGNGHGTGLDNSKKDSEPEEVNCNPASSEGQITSGGQNTSFDKSCDAEINDQPTRLDSGQKQQRSDVTEPSLLGALTQALPVPSNPECDSSEGQNSNPTITEEASGLDALKSTSEAKTKKLTEDLNITMDGSDTGDTEMQNDINKEKIQSQNGADIKLKGSERKESEAMEEDQFFDAEGDVNVRDSKDVVPVNTGENPIPHAQIDNNTVSGGLDDVKGKNHVNMANITDTEQGILQIERENFERVTSPQESNELDGQQHANNFTADSSQVCSSPSSDNPGVTSDQSGKKNIADSPMENVTDSDPLNQAEHHHVDCVQPTQEAHDLNVAGGMQLHTPQNTNTDLKALTVKEKEQLPDFAATVSEQDKSGVAQLESVVPTHTSATSNQEQHSDQQKSSPGNQQDDATKKDIGEVDDGNNVGVTPTSQASDNSVSNKEITEEETSVKSQHLRGDEDTKTATPVKTTDQNSNSTANMAEDKDVGVMNGEGEEVPITKGQYNLDFLDKLDDPNFNPFQSKSKMSADEANTCIEDKNTPGLGESDECKTVISDEPSHTDSTSKGSSHDEPPVTNNNIEKDSIIIVDDLSDRTVQSKSAAANSKTSGKADNTDVNPEVQSKSECDDNRNEVAADVSGDGLQHMDSSADKSSTAEDLEGPTKHNLVEEKSELKSDEHKRSEPAVLNNNNEQEDVEFVDTKENIEHSVNSDQETAGLEEASAEGKTNQQSSETGNLNSLENSHKSDSISKSEEEMAKPTAHSVSEVLENNQTGSPVIDTESVEPQSSALVGDMEISQTVTSSQTGPNINLDSQISSSSIESSCDTNKEHVIEKTSDMDDKVDMQRRRAGQEW